LPVPGDMGRAHALRARPDADGPPGRDAEPVTVSSRHPRATPLDAGHAHGRPDRHADAQPHAHAVPHALSDPDPDALADGYARALREPHADAFSHRRAGIGPLDSFFR
ncbi:MAG: hypothetical protein ACLGIN_11175, partial [Candidatus Sericytochromatia bacterium]